mgnify:CR=1 FL=1
MDIVLGNYKGLKANIPYIAYTEEDVNSQIATLLSGNPVREQKTGPLAMGDTAVIDYDILWELVQALLFRALRSSL